LTGFTSIAMEHIKLLLIDPELDVYS